jgi:peptidoglycan/xylan/chitin deacetylase (PgdA/CDA1 family)
VSALRQLLRDLRPLSAGPRIVWLAQTVARALGSRGSAYPDAAPARPASVAFVGWSRDGGCELAARFFMGQGQADSGVPRVQFTSIGPDARAEPATAMTSLDHVDLLVTTDYRAAAILGWDSRRRRNTTVVPLEAFDPEDQLERSRLREPERGASSEPAFVDRLRRGVRGLVERLHTPVQPRPRPTPPGLKAVARRVLGSRTVQPLWSPFTRDAAVILMLHRFADPDLGVEGHDPSALSARLEYLRRERFHLLSLDELVRRMAAGEAPQPRSVVFTVDDGYSDFARIGAPVFERYDCPATLFVVTGFADGECWLWYDAVEFLLGEEVRGDLSVTVGDRSVHLRWNSDDERRRVVAGFIEVLKEVPGDVIPDVITWLSAARGVTLPSTPPPRSAPISWEEARRLSARGMQFAPHTHTHPILSRAGEARALREIRHSWERISREVPGAVSILCYPNGMPNDFGARERRLALVAGFRGAVRASGGWCSLRRFQEDPFAIPRTSYDSDPTRFRQSVSGLERLKSAGRRKVWP